MKYSPLKTVGKAVPPLILIVIIRAIIAAVNAAGMAIDESLIWTIATGGFSALLAFINWIKNHKKKGGIIEATKDSIGQ